VKSVNSETLECAAGNPVLMVKSTYRDLKYIRPATCTTIAENFDDMTLPSYRCQIQYGK